MSKIKLEVGKTYRTRDEEVVTIVAYSRVGDEDAYPFEGDNGEWYRENGRYAVDDCAYDLIEDLTQSSPTPLTVTVSERNTHQPTKFPALYKCKHNGVIVLFTDSTTGTLVARSGNSTDSLGQHSSFWCISDFEPFVGDVTLHGH